MKKPSDGPSLAAGGFPVVAALGKALAIAGRGITAITGPWTGKNVITWVAVIGVALIIRWLLFETFAIPTGSMEPTLHGDPRWLRGDRVGVNKFVFGPRVPFMDQRLFHLAAPKRWDIVVFHAVDPDAVHKTLVKRVVGLPGERIHIADGKIHVNGQAVEPPESLRNVLHYTDELEQDDQAIKRFALGMAQRDLRTSLLNPDNFTVKDLYAQLAQIRERVGAREIDALTSGDIDALTAELSPVSFDIVKQLFSFQQSMQYPMRYGILPDDEYSLVPENCYLVCGDNSRDSADGRCFGWLPNQHIVGRAFCILWPIPRWRDLTGFSKTWWGAGLLYGIPTFVVGYECVAAFRRRLRKRRAY